MMHDKTIFSWAIVGAGPAGIAVVGKLIDQGVSPKDILWIDPAFKVGDFGSKWQCVPSNTKVKLFLRFFAQYKAFEYAMAPKHFAIHDVDPEQTCLLALAAEPLQWITAVLQKKVYARYDEVRHLRLCQNRWEITLTNETVSARQVVLAIGSEPKSLAFPDVAEIPLATALNPEPLSLVCGSNDVVAVFGSSHSAILILKNLIEHCLVKKVINFYLEPLRYAVYFDDWILFDDTGLKGQAAVWARTFIDGCWPKSLERVITNEDTLATQLPLATKAIYATGFQRRHVDIAGLPQHFIYNPSNGIIAPGLFGIGIAFPEAKMDRYGAVEYRVGLWKFVEYLNNVFPIWLRYGAQQEDNIMHSVLSSQ